MKLSFIILLASVRIHAAVWFDGVTGNFNSSSGVYNFTTGSNPGTITCSFWCSSYVTNYASVTSGLMQKGTTSGNDERLLEFRINGTQTNRLEFVYKDNVSAFHIFAGARQFFRTTNEWRHVAFTYNYGTGSTAKMYIDGVLSDFAWVSGSGNVAPFTNNNTFTFGGSVGGPSQVRMQDLAFWNTILTPFEIEGLYSSRVKGYPMQIRNSNLLVYYSCDYGIDNATLPAVTSRGRESSKNLAHAVPDTSVRCFPETIMSYPPNQ